MRRLPLACLPLLLLALLAALPGCVTVEPTATGAPAGPAQDPDHFAVVCQLADEDKAPLGEGTCLYRFGGLGSEVAVDSEGKAVRMVPAGAEGTLRAAAPGRSMVEATIVADRPVSVRFILPPLPKAAASASAPEGSGSAGSAGNATGEAGNATQEAGEEVENATVYFEPVRDLLFKQPYLILPGDPPAVQSYTFDVAEGYDTLELAGQYSAPAYAALLDVYVYGPDGSEVVSYSGLDTNALVTGTGGSAQSFPIGFAYDPEPGTYRVSIFGAGAPTVTVSAYGLAGGAPDFSFQDIVNGTERHLRDFVGRVVVVDMMATWCGPCQDAMPGLRAIKRDYGSAVEIVSVDVDTTESHDDLDGFRKAYGVTWPIGFEAGDSATNAYGTGWIPTMVVVDRHGGLLYRHIGEIDQADLRELIDFALER